MWQLTTPVLELIARALIIYFALLVLMRLGGKHQVGELAPFDFVMLLIIGNAVENAMTGGDESVVAGLALSAVIIGIGFMMSVVVFQSRKLENIVDGEPLIVVEDGRINEQALRSERLTMDELLSGLREKGVFSPEEVRYAILETNGHLSVLKKGEGPRQVAGLDSIRR